MSRERKIKAEEKRLKLALDFNEKLNDFYEDEQKRTDPDTAWKNALLRLDKYAYRLTKEKPQEQNLIIQAIRKLESAFARVKAGETA